MKNNLLPSLVMLLAGLVCSIISLRQGVDLMSFTTRLLTVLVVFYIIGAILKVILSFHYDPCLPVYYSAAS